MSEKKQTIPESPELIAARARRDKLRRDRDELEEFAAELRDRIARAEKSLNHAELTWRNEDRAAVAAREKGGYVATTSHGARAEFRQKVATEIADARRKLGEDEVDYMERVERRKRAQTRDEQLQNAERAVDELEAQRANASLLAGAPELTDALREIAEQLKVAGATTFAGVQVVRAPDGAVTFTVRTSAAQPETKKIDDSPRGRLQARLAAETQSRKRQRIHEAAE